MGYKRIVYLRGFDILKERMIILMEWGYRFKGDLVFLKLSIRNVWFNGNWV